MFRVLVTRGTFDTKEEAARHASEVIQLGPEKVIGVRVEPSARAVARGDGTIAEVMELEFHGFNRKK